MSQEVAEPKITSVRLHFEYADGTTCMFEATDADQNVIKSSSVMRAPSLMRLDSRSMVPLNIESRSVTVSIESGHWKVTMPASEST